MFYHGIIDLISFCEFAKGLHSPNMLSHLGIFQSNIKKKYSIILQKLFCLIFSKIR